MNINAPAGDAAESHPHTEDPTFQIITRHNNNNNKNNKRNGCIYPPHPLKFTTAIPLGTTSYPGSEIFSWKFIGKVEPVEVILEKSDSQFSCELLLFLIKTHLTSFRFI